MRDYRWIVTSMFFLSACGVFNRSTSAPSSSADSSGATVKSVTSEFAESLLLPTGMTRQSGVEAVAKIIQLFPNANLGPGVAASASSVPLQVSMRTAATQDLMNPEALFQPSTVIGTGTSLYSSLQAIAGQDRSTGPLALLKARDIFNQLCNPINQPASQSILFVSDSTILKKGESFPTDPGTLVAFTVARRAWNFAYTADSAEVQVLKRAYDDPTATTDAAKKKNVCLTALLSDQFWQGNPDSADVLNRIGVSLAGTRPTLQQIEDYKNGTLTLKDYVHFLQTDPGTSESYLNNVFRWHAVRMGLRTFDFFEDNIILDSYKTELTQLSDLALAYYQANFGNASVTTNGVPIVASEYSFSKAVDGCPMSASYGVDWTSSITGRTSGTVKTDQPFDPRTTGIFWEQYNPSLSAFQVIGGWVLKTFIGQWRTAVGSSGGTDADYITANCDVDTGDSRWLKCRGKFTVGGVDQTISLSDIKHPDETDGSPSPVDTIAADTVLAQLTNGTALAPRLRRSVRYSPPTAENPSGRNDGYSKIKGFFTNRDVLACNSVMRFITSCAYSPPSTATDIILPNNHRCRYGSGQCAAISSDLPANVFTAANGTKYMKGYYLQWRADKAIPSRRGWDGDSNAIVTHAFAHPRVLNSFRCGNVNMNALAGIGQAYNLDAAVPYGYDPLPATYSASDPNLVNGVPKSWIAASGQTYAQSISQPGLNQIATRATNRWPGSVRDGYEGKEQMGKELLQEPYRLLRALITQRDPVTGAADTSLDYSMLTTANFTYISKPLELYYRMKGEAMGIRPSNFSFGSSDDRSIQKVFIQGQSTKFISYPARLQVSYASNGLVTSDRPAAGILQMPAFLHAMAPGSPRSLANRVFARLLCGDPNMYDPAVDGKQLDHIASFNQIATVGIHGYPAASAFVTGTAGAKEKNFVTNHLNRPDCMTCHQNLDPLGMSLFKYYGSNLGWGHQIGGSSGFGTERPELAPPASIWSHPFGAAADDTVIGHGMFLGKEANGFGGVGKIVSESRLFYSCAAQDAFQNMFGRMPTSIEARKAYKNVVDQFMESKNYNEMIQGLAEIQENLGGE